MKKISLVVLALFLLLTAARSAPASEEALRRALDFYASIMVRLPNGGGGGWPRGFAANRAYGTGEAGQPIPSDCICIQDAATPATAMTFLRAGQQLGDQRYIDVARETGDLLLASMCANGGWDCEMWLGPQGPMNVHLYPGKRDWSKGQPTSGTNKAVYDDGTTFNPAEFLYCLWFVTREQSYFDGWKRVMDGIVRNQRKSGGYPQIAGAGGYHSYATFNDGVMTNSVNALLRAYQRTGDRSYLESVVRCGDFLIRVQSKGGGYGAQYDDSGRIQGARRFEPPGLGPDATSWAIGILTKVYDWTGDPKYLQPINRAVAWLERSKIGNNRWARYYHPDNDRPWYRSIDGRDVGSAGQAKPGYTWEGAWGSSGISLGRRYANRGQGQPRSVPTGGNPEAGVVIRASSGRSNFNMTAQEALASLTPEGYWPESRGRGSSKKRKGGGGGGGGGTPPLQMGRFVGGVNALLDQLGGTTAPPEDEEQPTGGEGDDEEEDAGEE